MRAYTTQGFARPSPLAPYRSVAGKRGHSLLAFQGMNRMRAHRGILSYSSNSARTRGGDGGNGGAPPESSIIQSTLEPEGPKWR